MTDKIILNDAFIGATIIIDSIIIITFFSIHLNSISTNRLALIILGKAKSLNTGNAVIDITALTIRVVRAIYQARNISSSIKSVKIQSRANVTISNCCKAVIAISHTRKTLSHQTTVESYICTVEFRLNDTRTRTAIIIGFITVITCFFRD